MKALFRNHFPFVEGTPIEELDGSQLLIKQTYDKLYSSDSVPVVTDSEKDSRSDTATEAKTNRLRKVHADERPLEGSGE
jgi:hypothetical protein